jgi:hypothetical protein
MQEYFAVIAHRDKFQASGRSPGSRVTEPVLPGYLPMQTLHSGVSTGHQLAYRCGGSAGIIVKQCTGFPFNPDHKSSQGTCSCSADYHAAAEIMSMSIHNN